MYHSKITLGHKLANRPFNWLDALVVYSIAPCRERSRSSRPRRQRHPHRCHRDTRPPVETPYDADRTAPSPNDGRRTIVAPPYPDYPNGSITGVGSVALDWDDVPTALSYAVQVHTGTAWTLLPWNDVTIQFSGTSAQIDGPARTTTPTTCASEPKTPPETPPGLDSP